MKKINYPLIVSDYDGTLLRSDRTVAEETRQSIERYVQSGGVFVLSSGRMTPSILGVAKGLSLHGIVAAYNGAEVVDIDTGKRLFSAHLPNADAVRICEYLQSLNLHFNVYDGDEFCTNRQDWLLSHYEKVCQVHAKLVEDESMSSYVDRSGMKVVKIAVITTPEERDEIYEKLSEKFSDKYIVVRSAKFLVELCDKSYSKGTAIEYIANHYNIPLEKTIAIGDNENDLSMLQKAGLGFSVANGEDSLRGKVAFLDETNNENAVGKVIDKYGFLED